MEKYLISLDLDDTLLNKKGKLSLLTTIGLKALLRNGHYIILNSGRPYQAMIPFIKKLKLFNYPFIACNGGAIYYLNHDENIVKCIPFGIHHEIINDFFTEIKPYLVYAYLQAANDCFYYKEESVPSFMKHPHKNVFAMPINSFRINQDIILAAFSAKREYKKDILKIMRKSRYKNLSFLDWSGDDGDLYFDIQSSSTNKGLAMLHLAKKLKVKNNNILAFGDQQNDISMLEAANKGFLMPNHSELAKKFSIEEIKYDAAHSGVIRHLFKYYRHLF